MVLVGAIACTAAQFPDYPVRELEEYARRVNRSGITVAVEPLSAKEQRIYLGVDLGKKGYLPVFVAARNGTDASWLLRKDSITYGAVASSVPEIKSRGGESAVVADLALNTAAMVALAPVGGAPLPVLSSIGLQSISRAADVRQNLLRRELQSKTLSPGGTTSGFIYVPVRKQAVRLQITLTRAGTSEVEKFEFDVK